MASSNVPNSLNPYVHLVLGGGRLAMDVLRRVRWDLTPESWRSRRKLRALRNTYTGKKAVILCNGPSLLKSDLSLLGDVYTFGLNKINLLFERSTFRPSCIVAVNRFVIEQNAAFYRETATPLFLDSRGVRHVKPRPSICFVQTTSQVAFARDCSFSAYQGATVTYVAIQLAYHLGFSRVALIGCDHKFAVQGPAHAVVSAGSRDESHFDPRYFSGGMHWQLPDLDTSEMAYILARQAFAASGRTIVNATVGGDLQVLPRMSLEQFVSA